MANKVVFSSEQIQDIVHLYVDEKWSSTKIGKKYRCSFGPIERTLKEQNIEIKRKEKRKYREGDIVGNNFIFIERIRPINNGKGYLCKFKCPLCGKFFEADLYNITSKNSQYISCGCYRKKYVQFKPDISIIGKRFGHLVVLEDDGTRVDCQNSPNKGNVKWKCKCDCGKIVYVPGNKLKSKHTTSCGQCCLSKGEDLIKQLLIELDISFEQQKRFKNCKDKGILPFDFYLPDYNCCIEFDGEQHFHCPKNKNSTIFTEDKIKDIQKKDSIKNQYCKNNNIKLIRFSYLDYNTHTITKESLFKKITGD